MNFIKNNLANAFTLGNLFSGCIGAIHLLAGDYLTTAYCIVISLVLDFFDGFVARALKANSNLGVQLDSLADMVSFGLLPGLTMFTMLKNSGITPDYGAYLGLLITLFSCLRLAIFNIDDEQKFYFKGLNTPSNTILIFGLYFAYQEQQAFATIVENPWVLLLITIVSSWLLVSPIKMMAMKFKSKKLKDNIPALVLVLGSLLILVGLGIIGIPLVILYYILISVIVLPQTKTPQ
ncbi:CDP-alcohol phosphatidyltransferase family protein [Riemerella columbina]|uniref:CDP-alcohol phosphatidyltransferase family protein n=1 Tax=Riemerella columbina TaxID=103810 RepID=UPI00266FE5DE|nr:CDP-alcohol phosphatidyltransferase family protein [Riemerella columbina]WKS95573.1 CDP-alcohol phosphatidyltransferase family protein [Riemerella columbina]